jgi:hypothetical protein
VGISLAASLTIVVSCGGSRRPPLLTDEPDSTDAGDDATPSLNLVGTSAPPSCGIGPDGGICACVDVPLVFTNPPNIYYVLDRSGSMNDLNKWTTVRGAVIKVTEGLGPRAKFGAAVFPSPNSVTGCTVGVEVMSARQGDAPSGVVGPTLRTLTSAMNVPAAGGTPTAATLNALLPRLQALPGKTYVILATDGGPNCNDTAACGPDLCIDNIESAPGCTPNALPNCCAPGVASGPEGCLDAQPTVDAVGNLARAGIQTFVIGVPGSGPYSSLLDALAKTGGTARSTEPLYYNVDSADEGALLGALGPIAAKIAASCTLPLGQAPPDPGLVNVYLDEVVVPKDPVNGWQLDGDRVTLLGTTCDRVLTGQVLDVRVIAGCPTVER